MLFAHDFHVSCFPTIFKQISSNFILTVRTVLQEKSLFCQVVQNFLVCCY